MNNIIWHDYDPENHPKPKKGEVILWYYPAMSYTRGGYLSSCTMLEFAPHRAKDGFSKYARIALP